MIRIVDAIIALTPNAKFQVFENDFSQIDWQSDDIEKPTNEEIKAKLHGLELKEPMKMLREIRNQKLFETDWWCVSDRVPTAEQLKYRQELRDITSIATPYFDKDGNFYVDTQFTWPEKPE